MSKYLLTWKRPDKFSFEIPHRIFFSPKIRPQIQTLSPPPHDLVDTDYAAEQNDAFSEQTPENAIEIGINAAHGSSHNDASIQQTEAATGIGANAAVGETVTAEYDQHMAVDEAKFIAIDSMDSVAVPTTIDK